MIQEPRNPLQVMDLVHDNDRSDPLSYSVKYPQQNRFLKRIFMT